MLGLGLSLVYARLSKKKVSALISRYEDRVIADGGTIESPSCISNLGLDIYNWTYYYRVIDDGGIVESLECTL